jgi:hypothetical protein
MRVLLSTYLECAELLARVGVPLLPIGVWL